MYRAKQSGCPIGDWVITRVGAQAARWRAQMPDDHGLLVAIDLSACQLAEPDFAATVTAAVLAAGARPEDLVLELTETAIIEGDQALGATLPQPVPKATLLGRPLRSAEVADLLPVAGRPTAHRA